MTANQLLNFLEMTFVELNWTISPNLSLGIISTSTFELSKNTQKLQKLLAKIANNSQNFKENSSFKQNLNLESSHKNQKTSDQNQNFNLETLKPKIQNSNLLKSGENLTENLNLKIDNQKTENNSQNSILQNLNPVELSAFLAPQMQLFCQNLQVKIQITATGPYLNLDLSGEKWQNFLES